MRVPKNYTHCKAIALSMAASVTKKLWEIGDIVDVLEAWDKLVQCCG